MMISIPSRRSIAIVAALCVMALLLSAAVDRTRASQLAAGGRIATALLELGVVAGLRDEHGAATLRPLPVAANLEGGPLWLHVELEAALQADPVFELADSPNLVRMEVVGSEHAFGLATALYRQGWNLRLPHPVRIRIAPWLATITAVVGVFVSLALQRVGWGLLVAGGAAQLVSSWLPWEATLQPASWSVAVREGPLGSAVMAWASTLPDSSLAIGAGVIALCTILVFFDHRRSPARGGFLVVHGLAGVAGLLLWVEAAARESGMLAWARTGAGALSLVVLVAAWVTSVALRDGDR
jgi:hypothetical protein